MIEFEHLNCDGCPALFLKKKYQNHFHHSERLREYEIKKLNNINLFLLGESIPANRFIYDLDSEYEKDGIRYHLRRELPDCKEDINVIKFLNKYGIVICDCALCPLHKIGYNEIASIKRKTAATHCLKNNTYVNLEISRDAPIITFFSNDRGFDENEIPTIANRISAKLPFKLSGLLENINKTLKLEIH